jgi:hypothetical protein
MNPWQMDNLIYSNVLDRVVEPGAYYWAKLLKITPNFESKGT